VTIFCDKERRDPVRAETEERYNQHHSKIRDNVERMFVVLSKIGSRYKLYYLVWFNLVRSCNIARNIDICCNCHQREPVYHMVGN
jgi:hypothetical protein